MRKNNSINFTSERERTNYLLQKCMENYDDQSFSYIEQNVVMFRMIFCPHVTGELKAKLSRMIEGLCRLLLTEK